ncbi:hypothetical protein [uncultured Microbulbifer sp.]|nr:hypothetical protein [uncultured Microbulbifer sp.]
MQILQEQKSARRTKKSSFGCFFCARDLNFHRNGPLLVQTLMQYGKL